VTHAAEAFRQAGQLFAERAAAPLAPAASTGVQALVGAALHHVSSIPVGSPLHRVLLWPLLVVASDAVRPGDRDVVRLRCPDALREPGFCGPASGLDVLERVWAVEDGVVAAASAWDVPPTWDGPRVSALGAASARWRSAMVAMQMEFGLM
jgi:hypothetical protein